MRRRYRFAIGLQVVLAACSEDERNTEDAQAASPLDAPLPEAFCEIDLEGTGTIAMEDDYLAHVVQCENGGAPLEALKAQAVAARSVAYYAMGTAGSICDSQGCQVYSCGKDPLPIHRQAVRETSGQYLSYNGNLTYGAYVAGDPDTSAPDCVGQNESSYITYNDGKTGTDVTQTSLIFRFDPGDATYGQNRGCMSQNGASCLADAGKTYVDILRFYYGADIQVLRAEGACIAPSGEGGAGATATSVSVSNGATSGGSPTSGAGAGGGAGGGETGGEDAGCDCSVGAGRHGPSTLLGVALAAFLAVRRRERRPRA